MYKVLCLIISLLSFILLTTSASLNCSDGQLPFNSTCVPIAYLKGCAEYLSDGKCQTCQFGYALSSAGTCQSNVNQTRDCCNAYNADGSCAKCSNGLFWADPYCKRNQINGCIKKDQNQCLTCGKDYFLYNGTCLLRIDGCQKYDQNGECVGCLKGNKLVSRYCYPYTALENCKYQNDYGCVHCNDRYYLSSSRNCLLYESGCLKYWQGTCVACHPHFQLNQNKKCTIDGCKTYNSDSCAQCQQGYTSQHGKCSFNGCIKIVNNSCIQCKKGLRLSSKGCVQPSIYQCKDCSVGFNFLNNSCIKNVQGCIQYDSKNFCKTCKEPFKLTINGYCQIFGCQNYNDDGCLSCSSPFALSNKGCVINNCREYVADGCSSCQDGYQLFGKQCYVKDANCFEYSKDSNTTPTCVKCNTRYFLYQGACKPASKGCNYDTQGNCICKDPFRITPNGFCEILGCNSYDWETCLSCGSFFSYNSQNQLCVINNCLQYSWTGCVSCSVGWAAVGGQCLSGDSYCLQYDAKGVCISCNSSFILDANSSCVKNIQYCNVFSSNRLSCSECKTGFVLLNGLCYSNIDNCQNMSLQNSLSFCQTCNSGYHLSKGICLANDFNCLNYVLSNDQLTENCSKCKSGFYFAVNGDCIAQLVGCVYNGSDCVNCIPPFLFDSDKKSCYISGCKGYGKSGCSSCFSPFKLNNSSCLIDFCSAYNATSCVSCISGYALIESGHCALIDPNCLKFQQSLCSQCKDGFSLNNGTCVVLDINCLSYSNGACKSCVPNYYLSAAKKCLIKQNGCQYESGVCKYCTPPFTFNENRKACIIHACLEASSSGCIRCKSPFVVSAEKVCSLKNCRRNDTSGCIQCSPQYHLKNKQCFADDKNCQTYINGTCGLCLNGYTLSSNGQCTETSNSSCISYSSQDGSKCLQCGREYFLNSFYQCEKKSPNCQEYINGVCSKCSQRFFLYNSICFKYTKGCVHYSGKDCTQCKVNYELRNGQCFLWNKQNMKLLGGDDHYDFDFTPIDVRQSKYYIKNLSPGSAIGEFFFSSYLDLSYQDCSLSTLQGNPSKGWKAKYADQNQYIGIKTNDTPVTFYAIQLQAIQDNYITQFYLQYLVNGTEFTTVQNSFKVPSSVSKNMTTIYFTGIYASAIRIRINGFKGWPAARIELFYYDQIRFKKISNVKSLTYLQYAINSTFVDRVDNQIYINQVYFFNPNAACTIQQMCFTGLQLCKAREINGVALSFQDPSNYVTQFYLTYTIDGRSYNCYKNCQVFTVDKLTNGTFYLKLQAFPAQGVRIYPKKYQGSSNFSPTFFYD